MTFNAELSQVIAKIEAERNARKARAAALRTVRIMRKAGKSTAEIMAWARAA